MVQHLREIDAYIDDAPEVARPILRKIRTMARDLCPEAREVVSYKMPALRQDRVFFYYAAFKNHIGIYPPLKQNKRLIAALSPYRGAKGNLQFQYDEHIPYALIGKVIAALHEEYAIKR
jgi:uncharacterized protein YdhG (YjbR/CyaY superfamily)